MNYAKVITADTANGIGFRTSIFVSGCEFKCPGCFNEVLWDFNYGKELTLNCINNLFGVISQPHIRGMTILGGEPLHPKNRETVSDLVLRFRYRFKDSKDIWLYTGYLYENLLSEDDIYLDNIFSCIDVLVDGPFIEEKKSLMLKFKGSSNQRIIDIKKSMASNSIVLYEM